MKYIAILVTKDHRGDHDADVEIAYEVREGETIQQLALRVKIHPMDAIKIKSIAEGAA